MTVCRCPVCGRYMFGWGVVYDLGRYCSVACALVAAKSEASQ